MYYALASAWIVNIATFSFAFIVGKKVLLDARKYLMLECTAQAFNLRSFTKTHNDDEKGNSKHRTVGELLTC